jgi:hypothetical protein
VTHRFYFHGKRVWSVLTQEQVFLDRKFMITLLRNIQLIEQERVLVERIFITEGPQPGTYVVQFPDILTLPPPTANSNL